MYTKLVTYLRNYPYIFLKEKEKEPKFLAPGWVGFLNILQQLSLAEKSYIEIGFLQNKHKSFLRKDVTMMVYLMIYFGFKYFVLQNSLRSVYESMKNDLRKIDENCKQAPIDKIVQKNCKNVSEFLSARINLIDL